MTTIRDLFADMHWDASPEETLDGYDMAAYFGTDVDVEFSSREEAVAVARSSYLGPDDFGIGLNLEDL